MFTDKVVRFLVGSLIDINKVMSFRFTFCKHFAKKVILDSSYLFTNKKVDEFKQVHAFDFTKSELKTLTS